MDEVYTFDKKIFTDDQLSEMSTAICEKHARCTTCPLKVETGVYLCTTRDPELKQKVADIYYKGLKKALIKAKYDMLKASVSHDSQVEIPEEDFMSLFND